ncbi:hypothetical protein K2173_007068 [Erythroxylum novogranatense]|uniref:Uncharacterized protein n=1 Tax=Erythroxylum novogranatense TaxID=1862640 RepID=A0AAV8SKN5_9ROSI|nr:hypothetical protein K2173_007068 [Erythroxylum novogranatense]
MEPGHRVQTTNDPNTQLATSVGEGDHSRKLSSSSCSSSSSSGHPFHQMDDDQISKSNSGKIAPFNHEKDNDQLASVHPSSYHKLNAELATHFPPEQVMERAAVDDATSTPKYRIPSHVFNRSKSNTAMDWSVASNESLFSIHIGNMSFTKEQLLWLGRSGELDFQGDYSSYQPPINQSPSNKPAEIVKLNVHDDDHFGETNGEVIRDNDVKSPPKKFVQSASLPRQSDASGTSGKSFAFPILTDDKSASTSGLSQPPSQPASPKVVQPQTWTESPKSGSTPKANSSGISRWLSCFPCFQFCC